MIEKRKGKCPLSFCFHFGAINQACLLFGLHFGAIIVKMRKASTTVAGAEKS